jgi:hypothetical protein
MGRGQTWSMDLIFGILIFLLAVGIIYAILAAKSKGDTGMLRIESEVIANKLATPDERVDTLQVATNNQLDMAKLGALANETATDPAAYARLKEQFGARHEFCIYLQDDAGNLVYIQDANGNKYTGIGPGDGELNISGTPCGKPVA